LFVEIANQRLHLVRQGRVELTYRVSTAAAGLNGQEGSLGTPPGVHTIARKIGEGAPVGRVFRSRKPTHEVWLPGIAPAHQSEEDLILSRILTLQGLETGLNCGPGCDSETRFIYIHGTNHEDKLGQPVSHGCIRLSNRDVIDLFARVKEGDPVVIL
jgi:UDP-N-acetylmuramate--alanine ligase